MGKAHAEGGKKGQRLGGQGEHPAARAYINPHTRMQATASERGLQHGDGQRKRALCGDADGQPCGKLTHSMSLYPPWRRSHPAALLVMTLGYAEGRTPQRLSRWRVWRATLE